MAKKGAKITQTHIRETSYHSIKLHLKQVFQSVYRHELETRLSHKSLKQETAKIPDWPRRKTVAEFRLALGMIAWVHIFTALESALTPTTCYAASANPWTETT